MGIEIKINSIHNRGVFALGPFLENSVIEVCEVITIPKKEIIDLDKTLLYNYYFS